jgi:hypothetical protein
LDAAAGRKTAASGLKPASRVHPIIIASMDSNAYILERRSV